MLAEGYPELGAGNRSSNAVRAAWTPSVPKDVCQVVSAGFYAVKADGCLTEAAVEGFEVL